MLKLTISLVAMVKGSFEMDVAYQKCTQILNDDVQKCFRYGETDYLCIFESNRKNKECQDRVSKMREVPKVCPNNSVLNKY